jgi:hypothetical protein
MTLMYMYEAPVQSCDPQTAIAIAEQPFGAERRHGAWNLIRPESPINESPNGAAYDDQERAVIVLSKSLDTVWSAGHRMKFWGA